MSLRRGEEVVAPLPEHSEISPMQIPVIACAAVGLIR